MYVINKLHKKLNINICELKPFSKILLRKLEILVVFVFWGRKTPEIALIFLELVLCCLFNLYINPIEIKNLFTRKTWHCYIASSWCYALYTYHSCIHNHNLFLFSPSEIWTCLSFWSTPTLGPVAMTSLLYPTTMAEWVEATVRIAHITETFQIPSVRFCHCFILS